MTEKRPFVLKNIVNHLLYPHHERESTKRPWQRLAISNNWNHLSAYVIWNILVLSIKGKVNKIAITHTIFCYKECRCLVAAWWFSPYIAVSYSCVQMTKDGTDNYILVQSWLLFHYYVIRWPCILSIVVWAQTSPLREMMRPCKFLPVSAKC
jgi:hypothetical protein